MGSLYKWDFSSYIFSLVQNVLRTDFLWVIVQFYAFARTRVFNKSELWSPWSIFLYTTDLNILHGLWSFVFLIFWLVFSLLGDVGCRPVISARVEISTQSNFTVLQYLQRPEQIFLPVLTNFIDRPRILSVSQIMDVIHILQASHWSAWDLMLACVNNILQPSHQGILEYAMPCHMEHQCYTLFPAHILRANKIHCERCSVHTILGIFLLDYAWGERVVSGQSWHRIMAHQANGLALGRKMTS